jgi:DNA polymerase-1
VPAPTLFLIDGSSQMYRAYHAFRGQGLTNQDGRSTHAVYVFVTMLRKLIADHRPDYIAASFDLPGPTFRDAIVDDYKANREAMPDELADQIEWVHEACESLGVPIVTAEGFEADDVIGTLTGRARAAGIEVAVVSIDKDFFQLVGEGVRVYDPRENGTWYDPEGVRAKFGVLPGQVVDVLALVGDTSDNVSGVPGVGRKGAVDLVTAHGSLDVLLAAVADLPQKKYREALTAHRADALRSRELVTIRTDVPLATVLDTLKYTGPDRARCYDLFSRLSFRSLTLEFAPTAETVVHDYALVRTPDELAALTARLRAAGAFALVALGDESSPMRGPLAGLAVSDVTGRARYVPLGHAGPAADLLGERVPTGGVDPEAALAGLRPVLEDAAVIKRGHDLKFAAVHLARRGVTLAGTGFDAMLASYVLDATGSAHGLDAAALEHLGYRAQPEADVRGKGARATAFSALTPDAVAPWACERADVAGQLAGCLPNRLAEAGLAGVLDELELPLVPVLAAMELAGVRVDTGVLAAQSATLQGRLDEYERRIHDLAGGPFNINSPRQLGEVLFEKLKLPALRKTGKTKSASTAVEVLEELADSHELPRLVLDWRGVSKLKSTYVDALPLLVNPGTGRIHSSFNQAVAATGRLSSSDPNLQNIPIRTEAGRAIRRAFVAEPGHVRISAAYSQIELRVLAHLAEEPALVVAFRNGEDIHARTAARVFGDDSPHEPHELRRRAKIVNFAILYGKTPFTLARDIGVTIEAADDFINAYFEEFPRVRAFIDHTLERGRETGVVTTLDGRRRLMPDLTSRNGQIRARAEREAVNMPIQGTAADILKRAMIALGTAVPASGLRARMILTVHDELLFEVATADADAAAALVREHMEGAARLAVPLTVDVGVGETWYDAKS